MDDKYRIVFFSKLISSEFFPYANRITVCSYFVILRLECTLDIMKAWTFSSGKNNRNPALSIQEILNTTWDECFSAGTSLGTATRQGLPGWCQGSSPEQVMRWELHKTHAHSAGEQRKSRDTCILMSLSTAQLWMSSQCALALY